MIDLNKELNDIPSASIYSYSPMGGGSRKSGAEIKFIVSSILSFDLLDDLVEKSLKEIKKLNFTTNISTDFCKSLPSIEIDIDKKRAFLYSVSFSEIANSISYLSSGKRVADFRLNADVCDVF